MITAAASVDRITSSAAFQKARGKYWLAAHTLTASDRVKALQALGFTQSQIADKSHQAHRHIIKQLSRIFDRLDVMRVNRHWAFKIHEYRLVVSLIRHEQNLLDAASIAEDVA